MDDSKLSSKISIQNVKKSVKKKSGPISTFPDVFATVGCLLLEKCADGVRPARPAERSDGTLFCNAPGLEGVRS